MMNDTTGTKSKTVKAVGIGSDLAKVGLGFSSINKFQKDAKISPASEAEIRQAGEKAFAGVRGLGSVLGAILVGPAEQVGVNNAIKSRNEFAAAEAYFSPDPAVRELAGRRLEASRAYQRSLPPLSDPSLDIISAGSGNKVRKAIEILKKYWTPEHVTSTDAKSSEDMAPIPGHRPSWKRTGIEEEGKTASASIREMDVTSPDIPICGTTEYYKIVGNSIPCKPPVAGNEASSERGWTEDGSQCFGEGLDFRELADGLGRDAFECPTVEVKDQGDLIIYINDCGEKGLAGLGFSHPSSDTIEMMVDIGSEKTKTQFRRCEAREDAGLDCSSAGKARWKAANPGGIMVQCGNP